MTKDRLFSTDAVDDSFYMSADLYVNKGVHEQTLEFQMEGQRNDARFTVYKQGIEDLSKFLIKWLEENK